MEPGFRLVKLKGEKCKELRPLWEEVFSEDSEVFTEYYFKEKAAGNYGYALEREEGAAAMLYLSPYPVMLRRGGAFACREINYIVGVATQKECRHRGCMDRLLKEALRDMHGKAQPFTFLMPADPAIYRPYQFTYIYDRMEYEVRDSFAGFTEKAVKGKQAGTLAGASGAEGGQRCTFVGKIGDRPDKAWKAAFFKRLAIAAESHLEQRYDVFIRRDTDYFQIMEKELQAQQGGIWAFEEGGTIRGYVFYAQEMGKPEIQESLWDKGENSDACPVKATGVKTPVIMARIVDVRAMLSLLWVERGEVSVDICVSDPILEGNNGIWECDFAKEKTSVRKKRPLEWKSAELTAASIERGGRNAGTAQMEGNMRLQAQREVRNAAANQPGRTAAASEEAVMTVDISVDALTSWAFGYQEAGQCFALPEWLSEKEKTEIWRQLGRIKRLERVWINEIV